MPAPLSPLLMGMKAAVFDVDGTLLDSMPAWDNVSLSYLQKRGLTPEPGLSDTFNRLSLEQIAVYYQTHYGIRDDVPTIVRENVAFIEQAYRERIPLKPGVKDFLFTLQRRGIPMALATASEKESVCAALQRCGVLSCFSVILTCTQVGAGKDTPLIFRRCAQELHTSPANTFVFEDSLYAARTARAAGFPVIGVYDDSAQADEDAMRQLCTGYVPGFDSLLPTGEAEKEGLS